ncbi:MAG: class I SAM-dependent DNA methyltransferase [Christensenellales bacterium]
MNCYSVLAKYYDVLMGDFDYSGYVAFLKGFLRGEGVDLCCGTGNIAIELASDCTMTGVDVSGEMLNVAADKATKAGRKVVWIEQDVSEFQPAHQVDFVTCVCDGFNYLSPDKLADTIDKISGYVKSGGRLVFDLSSSYKLQEILGNNIFCEDYDDITYIWNNAFDKKRQCVEMQISFFEKQQGDLYLRKDEEHTQYAHTLQYIYSLLKEKWSVQAYDQSTMKEPAKQSQRILFVATRK